ncbi:MAG TPA: serine hydrolase, partial [Chitinophagaceae bacterium]
MKPPLSILLPAIIFFISSCTTSKKMALRDLHSEIDKELAGKKGTFAIAFKDLKTGAEIKTNDHVVYHAASTMKTPVMIEVYNQESEGKFSLKDSIELKNEFKSIVDGSNFSLDSADDSEQELYKHIGEKRTIDSLLYQMIIVSSNFATDLIMQKVGAENVTATMRQLGAKDINVLRGVEDNKAFDKGLNNTTTAHD